MQNTRLSNKEKDRISAIPSPAYVVYEDRLRRNLELLSKVSRDCGFELIMALKANALWKTFPIIREYFSTTTASSLNEMMLSNDFMNGEVHAYCPAYTDETFPNFLKGCSHIVFNSVSQYERFAPMAAEFEKNTGKHVSLGLRVNPRVSVVDVDIYNPASPGARFGVSAEQMPDKLPDYIEGLHFHCLCENGAEELAKVLEKFESDFGKFLSSLKWVNFGGGHLITRKGYNVELLKKLIQGFKNRHPNLKVFMEPGSAFSWQTGDLIVEVVDVVENDGIRTAIIDASFACHMPDCLEMPYKPNILESLPEDSEGFRYRLGGNSCLTGDFVGDWVFEKPLEIGDRLTLMDMNHYTTVKTHMFNGLSHPSIWLVPSEGEPKLLREFGYEDYRDRMS